MKFLRTGGRLDNERRLSMVTYHASYVDKKKVSSKCFKVCAQNGYIKRDCKSKIRVDILEAVYRLKQICQAHRIEGDSSVIKF